MRPRLPLTHREFAEKYVKLATGPYKGQRFKVSRQPFTGLLFDEIDSGRWNAIYCGGPSQSSKTLSAFVIPTLWKVVELRESAVIAFPEADMAADKWDTDFLPTLKASDELRWLIPNSGPGSRGGRVKDRITLENGVDLKIMTRGGADTAKAGFTVDAIFVTEAKGWSGRSESSTEADDLRKLIARMRSFTRDRRLAIVEGTFGTPDELPWTARGGDEPDDPIISTKSRIESPCPHCEAWISPAREHLVGWQDARTELEAADLACFVCPQCGRRIDDAGRKASLAECRLVHHGQHVDKNGRVVGPMPPTTTLWFHWTCWHNVLLDAADTAVDEWKAAQIEEGTEERESAERELNQFAHGVPHVSTLAKVETLSPQTVRRRTTTWQRNLLPPDTEWLTIGGDLGKWTGWWLALAFRSNGELHVPAYGAFDVCRPGQDDDEATRVQLSLEQFDLEVVQIGFPVEGSDGLRLPDAVLFDMNYLPDEVAAFVRTRGKGLSNRWKCGRGRGKSRRNSGSYNHPKKVTKGGVLKIGTQWYCDFNYDRKVPEITHNADHWIDHLQDRLRIGPGNKGAMTLYRPDNVNASGRPRGGKASGEHAKLSNHLCADQIRKEFDPEKGGVVEKRICKGENHWGDCAKNALIMGDWLGWHLSDIEGDAPPDLQPENWWSRRLRP